ncbi:hypothetical protein NW754_000350 [Fusarium falciforme]|nr:hypothetical protein NW754_000350 [Fusarium falciforme]
MAKPWNEHRDIITKLYIQEGRTLEDVRVIMMTEHNFKASIRSYRQHFDIWDIRKYNCEKRQQRRRQIRNRVILPAPLCSTTALSSPSETFDLGSSPVSGCASLRASEPAIRQPPWYTPSPCFGTHQLPVPQSSSLTKARIKVEDEGVGTSCKDMYPSAAQRPPPERATIVRTPHLPQVLKSLSVDKRNTPSRRDLHYAYANSAHLPVQQATPPQPPPCSMPPRSHCLHDYCQPLPSYMPGFSCRGEVPSGLRAPNMPVVRGMEIIGP